MHASQSLKRTFELGSRNPQRVAWLRIAIAVWLLVLTGILYGSGHGGQWAWLLVVGAAVHFALAYRLFRLARKLQGRSR